MKKVAFLLISFLFLAGCIASKSPDAVEVKPSGSYKDVSDSRKTSVIIAGAYNNLEFDEGNFKDFRELFVWRDENGDLYNMDFADSSSPLYVRGRNNAVYLAIRVVPGKYKLHNFSIISSGKNYHGKVDFKNRYEATFYIDDNEVIFIGILRTTFDKFLSGKFDPDGETSLKIATFLENGKEDLYRITNFYSLATKKPVKTSIMYWNDTAPSRMETLVSRTK